MPCGQGARHSCPRGPRGPHPTTSPWPALHSVQVQPWPEVPESREGGRADLLSGCFWFADQQWLLREGTWPAGLQQQLQQDRVEEKELAAAVPSDSWCQTDPETQLSPLVQSQKRVVHPQLLWRLVLRVAERNGRQRRVSFQLKRTIEKPRLLGTHRRPEQLRLLCWLQDDCARRPPFPAPCPGALVLGPQRRSRLTRCSSLSLRRPCSRHSAQLRRYSRRRPPWGTGRGLQPCCPGSDLYFLGPQFPSFVKWKNVSTLLFLIAFSPDHSLLSL